MTIIETMLDKAKGRAARESLPFDRGPFPPGGGLAGAANSSALPASPSPSPSSSSARLTPPSLSIDTAAARENRLLLGNTGAKDRGLVAAYGMLRTRLLQRARAKGWTTLGVTSAAPQDGKSLTAVNLSLSIAREGTSTVVLIDLDFCSPSVCHLLGVSPTVELREYFQQPALGPEGLFISLGIDHLLVAGNTSTVENSAELLATARLEQLLDTTKHAMANPFVVVDLPPILHPDDALVVAPRLDALLIVASEGTTRRGEFAKALDLASAFPIAGVVLNRAREFPRKYRYGYGYGGRASPHG